MAKPSLFQVDKRVATASTAQVPIALAPGLRVGGFWATIPTKLALLAFGAANPSLPCMLCLLFCKKNAKRYITTVSHHESSGHGNTISIKCISI
jgi:hypothetical protein